MRKRFYILFVARDDDGQLRKIHIPVHYVYVLAIGAAIGIGFAVVGTLIALKVTGLLMPLRMNKTEEANGMDLVLHGEEGYNFES